MAVNNTKPLYLGKSLGDLNTLVETYGRLTNPRMVAKSASKLFHSAEEHRLTGDEEKSYVLYMRYYNTVQYIFKSTEYKKDKEYFDRMIKRSTLAVACEWAEMLAKSLEVRYNLLKEEAEVKGKLEKNKEEPVPIQAVTIEIGPKTSELNDVDASKLRTSKPGFITCQHLYELLNGKGNDLILMDVRSSNDYSKSHIKHSSIINVPSELLKPGVTTLQLDSVLPNDSKEIWTKRAYCDIVVLIDDSSSSTKAMVGQGISTLKDAVFKWDIKNVLKSEPLILCGGYDGWLKYYKTCTTGSGSNVDRAMNDDLPLHSDMLISPKLKLSKPGFITCQKLYELLKDEQNDLVLMDVRSANDYSSSHIRHLSSINIPSEIIKPGITAPKLELVLPSDSKDVWKKRGTCDIVVLIDWFSSSTKTPISQEVSTLKDAIFKWDVKTILKSEPLILCGGYDSWLTYYPTWTTRSDVDRPIYDDLSVNSDMITLNFDYPFVDLDKSFIDTSSDGNEDYITNRLNMLNIHGPTFDRSVKPKPHTALLQPSKVYSGSKIKLSNGDCQIEKPDAAAKESPKKNIPNVNRTVKPPIGAKVLSEGNENHRGMPMRKEEVQDFIDNNKKHLEAVLSLEKQQLEREKEFINLRLKREKEAEESMRLELQKQENLLLDKLAQMENERHTLDLEYSKLKEENDVLKRNIEDLHNMADSNKLRNEIEAMKKKDEERKNLDLEIKRLREERKKKENQAKTEIIVRPTGTPQGSPLVKKRNDLGSSSSTEKIGSEMSYMKLKDESSARKDTYSRQKLSRSNSFPNISHLYDNENMISQETSSEASGSMLHSPLGNMQDRLVPLVDRTSKPSQIELNAASNRNFMPVFGGQGRALTGLRNLGNTCYMNSVIQALANTIPLMNYFVTGSYRNDINRNSKCGHQGELVEEFAALIRALWTGQYRSLSPKDFKRVMSKYNMFDGFEQQDSHEFLTILMDSLQEDLNRLDSKKIREIQNEEKALQDSNLPEEKLAMKAWEIQKSLNNSIVAKLFKGQEKSTLKCLHCGKTSTKFGTFTCLSLSIPSGSKCTLNDCLQLYVTEEKLTGSQKWECPRCNVLREAVKKLDILKLPQILLIHLKRFFNEGVWRKKIQTFVDFPIDDLDLTKFVNASGKGPLYNLYGISNHYGTMEGGHCIAFCKNTNYNRWYRFDDHVVQKINLAEVKSSAAYILYYSSMNQ